MSVVLHGAVAHLHAPSRVEDAETLLSLLRSTPGGAADLSKAGMLHTAVFQVLLALRPPLTGPADDPFVQRWLVPMLQPIPPDPQPQ